MAARLVIAAALLFAAAAPAAAQQLARLHVRSFALTGDTAHPRLEVPFDVTLTIAVAERVTTLQNVYLPSFMGAEELGDVRSISQNAHGSIYRETLRLVAHASGSLSISPAYLDAIDARDGKPKRFISNSLQLEVAGVSPQAAAGTGRLLALAALALVVLGFGFSRMRRRVPLAIPAPPAAASGPELEAQVGEDPVHAALSQLRIRRDRPCVLALRRVLWNEVGAEPGQTLGQVLATPYAADPRIRRLLRVVERAAFIDDARLGAAIEDVLI